MTPFVSEGSEADLVEPAGTVPDAASAEAVDGDGCDDRQLTDVSAQTMLLASTAESTKRESPLTPGSATSSPVHEGRRSRTGATLPAGSDRLSARHQERIRADPTRNAWGIETYSIRRTK